MYKMQDSWHDSISVMLVSLNFTHMYEKMSRKTQMTSYLDEYHTLVVEQEWTFT